MRSHSRSEQEICHQKAGRGYQGWWEGRRGMGPEDQTAWRRPPGGLHLNEGFGLKSRPQPKQHSPGRELGPPSPGPPAVKGESYPWAWVRFKGPRCRTQTYTDGGCTDAVTSAGRAAHQPSSTG